MNPNKSFVTENRTATSTPPAAPGGDMGGMGGPPPPPGPVPGGDAGITPESVDKKDNLKILLESDNLTEDDSFIDLSKAKNSLGDIEIQLDKLLNS